jgi:Ca2+-binding RTX toxin-like protein
MTRITSNVQINSHNFSFGGATAAVATDTVVGSAAAGYRYGVNTFDNTMTTTYNGGASHLLSYEDNLVRPTTGPNTGIVTAGSLGAFIVQDLVGTTWKSAITVSDIGGSAVAFDAAVRSAGVADDSSFLTSILAGDDLITLSKFDDHMDTSTGNDTVRSGYGNDQVYAEAGNDRVDGGSGLDSLFGGGDNDNLSGARGADFLAGGDGNDILSGGDGNDVLAGGQGADVFLFRVGDDRDTITTFSQGVDLLQVSGMTALTPFTAVQEGADTVLTVKGIEIVLQNTLVAQMTVADFIFA